MKKQIRLSKYLSYILRHNPADIDLSLDESGWAEVDDLIKRVSEHSRYTLDLNSLTSIVRDDGKQRYSMRDGKIRANQGHSINVNAIDSASCNPPDILYHGTTREAWGQIKKSGGLSKMNRHHVHLSSGYDTALSVASRRRRKKPIVLEIKAKEMANSGSKFYLSENGVWLTEEVDLEYISDL